jgi:uncharacterized membrane protein YccC
MRYSIEIKKFLYSQYFYGGLRNAIGISLPAILMLVVFHDRELGFTISTGALGACVVDTPGPVKYKHNEMLACSVIGFLAALATGIASAHAITLWLTVVPLTFVLSLIVVYGTKWPNISFATLFMMVVTLNAHFTPLEALINAGWLLAGGLWYTYWSTFVSRFQISRLEQQAIAESVFACADYLLARANFYDLEIDLDDCNRELVAKQINAVQRQEAARDIVLRNLPKLRSGKLEPYRTMLFNLFINTVDLHELFVAVHTDYQMVRNTFGGSDLMVFYRDLIRKTAADLEDVGLAVLQNRTSRQRVNAKAELRAIEYEIALMRERDLPSKQPEAYAAVVATFRRVWSASRLIERMHRNTRQDTNPHEAEMRIDQALSHFLSSRRVLWTQIFSNLTMSSPSFRHALRVTIAVAVALGIGRLLPLANAYWIVITTLVILKPGYSLTKQRNLQRMFGTAIGCAATIALIVFVKDTRILLLVMFASMVMSYSLLLFNYGASVVFTSSYVLLLFQLLAPGGMRIVGERVIDTGIGCAIAIAASHLFPYWEYRLMGKLVNDLISATRQYLETCWNVGAKRAAAQDVAKAAGGTAGTRTANESTESGSAPARGAKLMPAPLASSASVQPTAAANAAAVAIDSDIRYRLARKNVHIAFANLGQAFQRMLLEPKSAQKYVAELNDLLVRSHVLTSHISTAAPLMQTLSPSSSAAAPGIIGRTRPWGEMPTPSLDGQVLTPLQHAITTVHDNLVKAEAGVPPPADQADIVRHLTPELDQMVVDAGRSADVSPDTLQELKVLAYECKRMLSESLLIRKDASLIKLPT